MAHWIVVGALVVGVVLGTIVFKLLNDNTETIFLPLIAYTLTILLVVTGGVHIAGRVDPEFGGPTEVKCVECECCSNT